MKEYEWKRKEMTVKEWEIMNKNEKQFEWNNFFPCCFFVEHIHGISSKSEFRKKLFYCQDTLTDAICLALSLYEWKNEKLWMKEWKIMNERMKE